MPTNDASTMTRPAPLSYAPSQYFDGNDGKWSSFIVRAGTPEQTFRVLPATVISEILIPLDGACKENATIDLKTCAFSRGAEEYQGRPNNGFQSQSSSTWHELGIYEVAARTELGYNASGLYGLDSLGLMIANSGGPTLLNQTIGAIVNPRLWVGRLGMDVKPNNFTDFENPQRSLIKTLKDEGHIPSLSYGYTAGAYYKKPSVFGSLTYGGYDQSRLVPNNITFPFDADDGRKPSLNIQTIVSRDLDNNTVNLLPGGATYTLVDFGESSIWLPVSACDEFARAFNLTYDNSTDLYLVNPETHTQLIETNPSVTFGLGQTADPAERVNIVLPYSAFDQEASYPIYQNATNYFPIRRANNNTQYTLGRAFFQEAYINVDYERGNFSIHQALFPTTGDEQHIVPVGSPEVAGDGFSNATHSIRLKGHDIAGIAAGCFVFVVVVLIIVSCMPRWRGRARKQNEPVDEEIRVECADQPKLETDGVAFYEKDGQPFAEMEGRVPPELYCPKASLTMNELSVRILGSSPSPVAELYEVRHDEKLACKFGEA